MNLEQTFQTVIELAKQGKFLEAAALLNKVQSELILMEDTGEILSELEELRSARFCPRCGKMGEFQEEDNLCDFCFTAQKNLGRGNASISQQEMEEERLDDYLKLNDESES